VTIRDRRDRRTIVSTLRGQRGGVISKVFIIPVGVVVIIGVFLLGYYMGRGRDDRSATAEKLPAMPEVVSQYLPKKEEFTFYQTLTEKGEKNVSVDLRPKRPEEQSPVLNNDGSRSGDELTGKKQSAVKPASPKAEPKAAVAAKQPVPAKKEPAAAKQAASKVRYTIQVAAYPDRGMAEDEVRSMKRRGYAAFVVASNLGDKGMWYRVRVGSFSNKQSADKLAGELKAKEGIATFVTAE
jgi:cell division septation protein DedD